MSRTENPLNYANPRAQALSDKWHETWEKIVDGIEDRKKLDEVGVAYLSEFLGFDKKIVSKFLKGDWKASNTIGHKQGALVVAPENIERFWDSVNTIFPNLHNQEELDFLIKEGGEVGVISFMDQIDRIGSEMSPVMRGINVNAHAYK
jgi:hypothetical protein